MQTNSVVRVMAGATITRILDIKFSRIFVDREPKIMTCVKIDTKVVTTTTSGVRKYKLSSVRLLQQINTPCQELWSVDDCMDKVSHLKTSLILLHKFLSH